MAADSERRQKTAKIRGHIFKIVFCTTVIKVEHLCGQDVVICVVFIMTKKSEIYVSIIT